MAKNNGFVENPQRLETNDFYRPVKAKKLSQGTDLNHSMDN